LNDSTSYSCVVDDTPGIWSGITPWLLTATGLGQVPPKNIVVQHVCQLREDVAQLCLRLGIMTRAIERFDPRSPHSNKIEQLSYDFSNANRIVLTDVDMAFTGPLPVNSVRAAVAGKLVDGPNPPLPVLQAIFEEAFVPLPRVTRTLGVRDGQTMTFETVLGNYNGGLYVIDASHRADLHREWSKWAIWLLDRVELMGRWQVHVDQVAFCLAVAELKLDTQVLEAHWNFPTHLYGYPAESEPLVIHHHGRLDNHILLQDVQSPFAKQAIKRTNAYLRSAYRDNFSNRTFWEHRYTFHPELGSGAGSRNDTLKLKREILAAAVPNHVSILDWGCGDLEVVRDFNWHNYCGIDLSDKALRIAAAKRADWKFLRPERFLAEDGSKRDLVICLDVLIHQHSRQAYLAVVDQLLELSAAVALISGYDAEPGLASNITYFHEPLKETLLRDPRIARLIPISIYRDTQLYFVEINSEHNIHSLKNTTELDKDQATREMHRILSVASK